MAEPKDLLDKLHDVREIAVSLIHDVTANPVSIQEATYLRTIGEIYLLLVSASRKAKKLEEEWIEE